MGAVEVAATEHAHAATAAAAALFGDLQRQAIEDDDVVTADDTLLLVTEDLLEIDGAERGEGRGGVGGGAAEGGIEVGQEVVAQIALAADTVLIPATRNSLTRRSCKVRLTRSLRPRAWGE
jgi:hypothetical protein